MRLIELAVALGVTRPTGIARQGHDLHLTREGDQRWTRPWLRINRVLRVMLHTRWSAEACAEVRVELWKALALRSQIRRGSS